MADTITFTKDGESREICEIKPDAPVIVQIERDSYSFFTIYGNLEGMPKVAIFNTFHMKDLIFKVDVPSGVTITLESGSHVVNAQTMDVE